MGCLRYTLNLKVMPVYKKCYFPAGYIWLEHYVWHAKKQSLGSIPPGIQNSLLAGREFCYVKPIDWLTQLWLEHIEGIGDSSNYFPQSRAFPRDECQQVWCKGIPSQPTESSVFQGGYTPEGVFIWY